MQIESSIPSKLRYEPLKISSQHHLDKLGSTTVVFKNYIIIFQGKSDGSTNNKIFYTFNINSHELREGKIQGKTPEKILDKGACMCDENTILMVGNSKGSSQDLFLLTITEGAELSIKSEMWLKDKKKEAFTKIWSFYKYKNEFYVFGIRMNLESSTIFKGLWKLENGEWKMNKEIHEGKRKEVGLKESERSCSIFHDGRLYAVGLNGNLSSGSILDMESLKWTSFCIGKNSSRNRMTFVGYDGTIYLFMGRSLTKDIETKFSGLYRYEKEQDEWSRVEFRGFHPPKIDPLICVASQKSLFILNPNAGSSQAFRIIMDSSESDTKKRSLFMNKDLADVVIKVDEKEFYCNKGILSSKFFQELFLNGSEYILDVKAFIFEAFLRYVYSVDMELKKEYVMDLYELATRWGVEDLKVDCDEYFRQNLTLENFGRIAQLASEAGEEELFEKATSYGLKNCKLLDENHLEDMSTSVLRKVICKFQKVEQRKKKKPERFIEETIC